MGQQDEVAIATMCAELGVKNDDDKLRLDLVPPEAEQAIAAVLGFGAAKYGDHNWRGGLRYSRVIGAILRHLHAWRSGVKLDEESGLPHLWHAAAGLAFLIAYEANPHRYSALDDLWRGE